MQLRDTYVNVDIKKFNKETKEKVAELQRKCQNPLVEDANNILKTPFNGKRSVPNTYLCTKCKGLPVGPVFTCKSCDTLYCSGCNAELTNSEAQCLNRKCKGMKKLVTEGVGRIIRAVMNSIVVNHRCSEDSEMEEYTYDKLVQHMFESGCEKYKPVQCPHRECD